MLELVWLWGQHNLKSGHVGETYALSYRGPLIWTYGWKISSRLRGWPRGQSHWVLMLSTRNNFTRLVQDSHRRGLRIFRIFSFGLASNKISRSLQATITSQYEYKFILMKGKLRGFNRAWFMIIVRFTLGSGYPKISLDEPITNPKVVSTLPSAGGVFSLGMGL